jgi:MYXO-CTERM domain-containing protein
MRRLPLPRLRFAPAPSLFLAIVVAIVALLAWPRDAYSGVGTFKLKSQEATEVSGAWHLYVTLELPKAPLTAHQSMKFLFTKEVVYERSLVDGHNEPVQNRQVLQNQTPSVESLDVDFADPSGKIFKGTRFDFGLTRARGYEAGEYKVEVRTSDGTNIGSAQRLILKGDNPVVDRRAIAFNAKEKSIKKVEGYDGGTTQAKNENGDVAPVNNGPAEVTPMGTATGFVPSEGQKETDEEKIKTKPKGCGCSMPGEEQSAAAFLFLLPVLGLGAIAVRRRSRRTA